MRNRKWGELDAKELVPGDIVRLNAGDCVPADIRIIALESVSLQVEEAPLTGESVSVQKKIDAIKVGFSWRRSSSRSKKHAFFINYY